VLIKLNDKISDEKIFTAQTPTNTQNDHVLKKRDLTPGSVKCFVNLLKIN